MASTNPAPATRCVNPECWNEKPEQTTVCLTCHTDKREPPRCNYYDRPCDCGGRNFCLEAA